MFLVFAVLAVSYGGDIVSKPESPTPARNAIVQEVTSQFFFSLGAECIAWNSTSAIKSDSAVFFGNSVLHQTSFTQCGRTSKA